MTLHTTEEVKELLELEIWLVDCPYIFLKAIITDEEQKQFITDVLIDARVKLCRTVQTLKDAFKMQDLFIKYFNEPSKMTKTFGEHSDEELFFWK